MSRTQKENIFAQSLFSNTIWAKVTKVIDFFEAGVLKDQKLNKKHAISAPELKQHHLQPLCRLPSKIQSNLLDAVINKTYSLKEMKVKADEYRQMEHIKKAFVKCTNSMSWECAESMYPNFTNNLSQFKSLIFRKPNEIPEVFKTYCQAALNSKSDDLTGTSINVKKVGDFRITLIKGQIQSMSLREIRDVDKLYNGAHLILTNVSKVQ